MTIETDIDALTTNVSQRKSKAIVTKASLPPLAADALAFRDVALSAANSTLAIRDQASSIATAATSVATASTGVTSHADLASKVLQKSETTRTVLIYDTSLDSDGGAWRYRTQGASWYNETLNTATRGSRREFPSVAVITTDDNGYITIYDADDPQMSMWMKLLWSNNPYRLSVSACNGLIAIGNRYTPNAGYAGNGLAIWDFPASRLRRSTVNSSSTAYLAYFDGFTSSDTLSAGPIGNWNNSLRQEYSLPSSDSYNINAVLLKTFEGAPVDTVSGLPVPKIFLGTQDGIIAIHEDGSITKDTTLDWNNDVYHLDIDPSNNLRFAAATSHHFYWPYPYVEAGAVYFSDTQFQRDLAQWYSWVNGICKFVSQSDSVVTFSHNSGLTRYLGDMHCYTASDFHTGWMPKGTRVVSYCSIYPYDVIEGSNLVQNGDFSNGITNWNYLAGTGSYTVTNGTLTLTADAGQTQYYFYQAVPVIPGKAYCFSQTGDGWVDLRYGNNSTITAQHSSVYTSGRLTNVAFVAKAPYLYIQLRHDSTWSYKTFSNISVTESDIDYAIPTNTKQYAKPIIVKGQVKKEPVAVGAQLMAYSGMRGALKNWLEQEYDSRLDFGTGDFSIMGWIYNDSYPPNSEPSPIYRGTDYYASASNIWVTIGSGFPKLTLGWSGSKDILSSSVKLPDGAWSFVVFTRVSGVVKIYVNDIDAHAGTSVTRDLTNTNAKLYFGCGLSNTGASWGDTSTKYALWRIGGFVVSRNSLSKIYNDEKALFQPGAHCAFYGSSNTVTSTAYDPVTNLLHVGTSAGTSVFDGLVRVRNTTTAVGLSISAVNDLVVEE